MDVVKDYAGKVKDRARRRSRGARAAAAEQVRAYRARLHSDPELAGRYLLRWLGRFSPRAWVLRKALLRRTNLRRGPVLTGVAAALEREGLLRLRVIRRERSTGGLSRPGTWYRLTDAGRAAARAVTVRV